MKQYIDLLKAIKEKGTWKDAAREGMPRTLSLFGYQNRYDLKDGFPLLTTKKLSFKNIVTELLWFLRGDTNIKYLVDNGCNIWNEDAYNYYIKIHKKTGSSELTSLKYDDFLARIGSPSTTIPDYIFGDCGKQYGWLWRHWEGSHKEYNDWGGRGYYSEATFIDQVKDLIDGLKKNPMSRRHIITAWNPATLDQMALHPCHVLSQFNCRPLTLEERTHWWFHNRKPNRDVVDYFGDNFGGESAMKELDKSNVPRYYLDCHMYQRSADVFLGVPYNIASYALLTHILCEICNMIPGDFIHSFGDVHIYENHMEQVDEQLTREPKALPKLLTGKMGDLHLEEVEFWDLSDFQLEGYDPDPAIKAKLSTGLK